MDISKTWQKLEKERLETPIEGDPQPNKKSNHPVTKLKHNYLIKTIMMIVFLTGFAVLFLTFDHYLVRIMLGVLVAAYIIFSIASFSMYRSIHSDMPTDDSLMNFLTKTKTHIERGLRFETITSLLIFPFAGSAGYLMGYIVSGADVDKIFNNGRSLSILVITVIIFTILGYFAGKNLKRAGYKKSLEQIEGMIKEMKTS